MTLQPTMAQPSRIANATLSRPNEPFPGSPTQRCRATGSILKMRTRKTLTALGHGLRSPLVKVESDAIIVLGNQKSGTSAIAHLLAHFGGLTRTIDIPPLWPPMGVRIMRGEVEFASMVRRHKSYFATKVIKEPMMTFFTEQVLGRFPQASYVFVVRDPRDNIRSLLNRRQIPGHLEQLDERFIPKSPPHNVVVDAEVWGGQGENYVGVLAHRWNKAADAYLRYPNRMILAEYERFVEDKVGFIESLAEQLGLAQLNDIRDQADVQFQPPGDRDVSWTAFFGRPNLERIERICADRMDRFGYGP